MRICKLYYLLKRSFPKKLWWWQRARILKTVQATPCFCILIVIIYFQTFTFRYTYLVCETPITFQLFWQFLAQCCCCLLVDFAFLFEFFFPNTHFVWKPNNNSKMRSWISLPSQFHFLLLFLSFFLKKKILFLFSGHHRPC